MVLKIHWCSQAPAVSVRDGEVKEKKKNLYCMGQLFQSVQLLLFLGQRMRGGSSLRDFCSTGNKIISRPNTNSISSSKKPPGEPGAGGELLPDPLCAPGR